MSYEVKEFVGYVMDVTQESFFGGEDIDFDYLFWFQSDFEVHFHQENYNDYPDIFDKYKKMKEVGFVGYGDLNHQKYPVTLLIDGFNGDYVKLIYALSYPGNETDEYSLEILDGGKNLRKTYEILFNKTPEESAKKPINLERVRHVV